MTECKECYRTIGSISARDHREKQYLDKEKTRPNKNAYGLCDKCYFLYLRLED